MKHIYLVRHGETQANIEERIPRETEPLNDTGRMQAEELAIRLTNIDFKNIIVSNFLRAQQTAEPIAKLKRLTPEVNSDFREMMEPSSLFGLAGDDERVRAYRRDRNENIGNKNWRYEDGETFTEVLQRVHSAKQYLQEQACEKILVVSHGLFLRIFMAAILLDVQAPSDHWWHTVRTLRKSNTGISLCTFEEEEWKIVLWNDHAHFAE